MSLARARVLRAKQTDLERKLWSALRQMKRIGFHFRRQPPIGKYYPDFACHRAKLIVELDGSQHAEQEQATHDAARTLFLESRGYRVLRFWNGELIENFDGVVEAIGRVAMQRRAELGGPPPDFSRCARKIDLPRRGR